MRDIFEDIFKDEPLDPREAARRSLRTNLPKRFYNDATAAPAEDGFRVLLDGRPVRTPAKHFLAAPALPIAQAVAEEWQAQKDIIDPATMPLTRLANSVIDGVVSAKDAVADEIVRFLGSDLLFYRAGEPAGLVARQNALWNPVIDFARDELGARFVLAEGLVHVRQPDEAIAAARAALPADAWRLGALNVVTTLTGSALLALALLKGVLTREAAWEAAHADEDWQMTQWGRDDLAMERRDYRFAEMTAAARVLDALRD